MACTGAVPPGDSPGKRAGTNKAISTIAYGYALDSSTGSDLIVTLAWRSAEIAGAASALMLLFALLVRRYLRYQDRLHAQVVAVWRPFLTQVAIEEGAAPALPPLPARHVPY